MAQGTIQQWFRLQKSKMSNKQIIKHNHPSSNPGAFDWREVGYNGTPVVDGRKLSGKRNGRRVNSFNYIYHPTEVIVQSYLDVTTTIYGLCL